MDTRQNPRAQYRTTERVHPGDAQQLLLLDGMAMKEAYSALSRAADDMAAFMMPIGGNPAVCNWRKGRAQWEKYHYYWPDEKS